MKVRLDDVEAAELARRAQSSGVSSPRFLVDAALRGGHQTVSERHALVRAFQAAKVSAAGAANNLNQLAHHANATGRLGVEAELLAAKARMEDLAAEMLAAARRLDETVS